jgi:pimeloyl-ACP methyl ester carboxylesterase
MQHSITLSNGVTVQYWTYHDDAQLTMVLIHGFTGSHEGFQYLIPLLPDINFIVPDLPGFGQSDLMPREEWSIDALARLANEFVASLALPKPPHILGHSMGGLVVSSMVSQSPDLYADDMVLISPVPTAIRANDARRGGAILGALQYKLGHRTGKFGERLVKSHTISRGLTWTLLHTTDKELRQAIYSHHFKNLEYISSIEFYSKLYTDINRHGSLDYARTLRRKRLLLLAGDKDTVAPPKEMRRFAEGVQPHTFTIIENVGHLIHYERPLEAARAIKAFLSLN